MGISTVGCYERAVKESVSKDLKSALSLALATPRREVMLYRAALKDQEVVGALMRTMVQAGGYDGILRKTLMSLARRC